METQSGCWLAYLVQLDFKCLMLCTVLFKDSSGRSFAKLIYKKNLFTVYLALCFSLLQVAAMILRGRNKPLAECCQEPKGAFSKVWVPFVTSQMAS